jgi:hypothetical protein
LDWAIFALCGLGGTHCAPPSLNAQTQQNETWQGGQDRRKLDREKEVFSYGPLGVSTGCSNFLEDVKVHLVMWLLNALSQQKETWQEGQDRKRLDAAKQK